MNDMRCGMNDMEVEGGGLEVGKKDGDWYIYP